MLARPHATKIALAVAGVLLGVVALGGLALATVPEIRASGIAASPLREDASAARRLAAILERLVRNGTITAEQKSKIVAAVREAPAVRRIVARRLLHRAAEVIGLGPGELKRELPGKSLAQVAAAHGISRDTLVSQLTADANAALDAAVEAGRLTTERAERIKARLPERIEKFVDRVVPIRAR